jgi:hypothetical protein
MVGNTIDLVLLCISTAAFYFLSNYFTYNIGIASPPTKPLFDVFHDILPDLSSYVSFRDLVIPLFFIPLVLLSWSSLGNLVYEFVEGFMYLVTLKAITIFFTFLPPSNTRCAEKRQLNHCFHQIFSGHNSFILLLCILLTKYLPWNRYKHVVTIQWVATVLYSIFILMTRAHYSVDVILSYIIVFLLVSAAGPA